MEFVTELKKSLDLSDDQMDLELIELPFVKNFSLAVSVEPFQLTKLAAIIPKIGQAVLLVFDFVYYKDAATPEKKDRPLLLQRSFSGQSAPPMGRR